ncbi:hypothetical protein HDK77DRAFT_457522 [Phyllosticta capitalensis]
MSLLLSLCRSPTHHLETAWFHSVLALPMRRWLPSCSPLLFSDATHRLHYPHRPGHLTNCRSSQFQMRRRVASVTMHTRRPSCRCAPDLTKPDAPRSVLDNDCISLRLCPWPDLQLVCPRRPLTRRPCLCFRFLMPSTRFEPASPSFAASVAGLTRLDVAPAVLFSDAKTSACALNVVVSCVILAIDCRAAKNEGPT